MSKETYEFTRRKIQQDRRASLRRLGITAGAAGLVLALGFVVNGDPLAISLAAVIFGLGTWYAQA